MKKPQMLKSTWQSFEGFLKNSIPGKAYAIKRAGKLNGKFILRSDAA